MNFQRIYIFPGFAEPGKFWIFNRHQSRGLGLFRESNFCQSVSGHLIPPLALEEFEEKELSISQGREPNVRRRESLGNSSLHRDQMTPPLLQEYSTSVLYYTITIQKTYLTEMAVAPLFVNGFSILKLHMKAEIQG